MRWLRPQFPAALLFLSAVVLQAEEPPIGHHGLLHPEQEAVDRLAPAERRGVPFDNVPNPGFEQLDAPDTPTGWTRIGLPVLREEEGNRFARVNLSHRYETDITARAIRRHLTLSVRARGETGLERLRMQIVQFGPPSALFAERRVPIGTTGWNRIYATHAIFDGVTALRLVSMGLDDTVWVDVDDVMLFDEGIANGSLEEDEDGPLAWRLNGGASIVDDSTMEPAGARALLLPTGAQAVKLAGALDDGQTYFVTGLVRADGTGTLVVEERQLTGSGAIAGVSATTETLTAAPMRFLLEPDNFTDAQAADIVLRNAGAANLVVDDVSRGFADVFPEVYFPGTGSPNPALELTAAWPNRLASASVEIRDREDNLVETVVLSLVDPGTAFGTWNGTGAAPGEYDVRFLLDDGNGTTIELDRSVEIRANPGYTEALAHKPGGIERGAWLWLFDVANDVEAVRPFVAQAKDDGFSFVIFFGFAAQLDTFAEAAALEEMPFVLASQNGDLLARFVPTFRRFNRHDFEQIMHEDIAPHTANPYFRGVYVFDEPIANYQADAVRHMMSIVHQNPDWGVAHTTFANQPNTVSAIQSIRPPVVWSDFHVLRQSNAVDCPGAYATYADHIGQMITAARSIGRDYWLVMQTFSDPTFFRLPDASSISATIGTALALGAKGYVTFVWRSINQFEGVRGRFLEETPETMIMREQNARVAGAAAALAGLTNHARLASPADVLASLADRPGGGRAVYVVNLDCFRTIDVRLRLSTSGVFVTELTTGESQQLLGNSFFLALAPGEWTVWSLSAGTVNSVESTPRAPTDELLALPVQLDQVIGTGPVHDIAFDSVGGRMLLARGASFTLIDSAGSVLATRPTHNALRATFGGDGRGYVADRGLGLWGIAADSPFEATDVFLRETGIATGILAAGSDAWMTASYWGIRRLDLGAGRAESLDFSFANALNETIEGTFADGSVLFLAMDAALARATFDEGTGIAVEAALLRDRLWRSDLSPSGERLAVARMRRGALVAELDANGGIVRAIEPAIGSHHIEDVAWLSDTTLLAADNNGTVHVIAFDAQGDALEVGRWRLPERIAGLMSIATHGATIAVGYFDGRLVLLDGTTLVGPLVGTEFWMFQ